MSYTLEIDPGGTIVLPKELLKELQKDGTSRILAIKTKTGYVFRAVKDILSLAGAVKTDIVMTDEDIKKARQNAFLRPKNIY